MQPLRGGLAPLTLASGPVVIPWYLAGGAITVANVAEWVENPAIEQLYAGGTLSSAWSIVAKTAYPAIDNSFLFDALNGRVLLGVSGANNGFYTGTWKSINLFSDTNTHVYYLISTGTSIQAYRDNVAISTPVTNSNDIGGVARWRGSNDQNPLYVWETSVPRGAIYKIALDSTQRAALLTSMNS